VVYVSVLNCALLLGLYVDDILLISPSIWRLEKLLCLQKELHWLYVAIKCNRAVYAWSSLWHSLYESKKYDRIHVAVGKLDKIRHLGVHFVLPNTSNAPLITPNLSLHGATNSIFGRLFVKQFALCYRTVVLSVCPVSLSVCLRCWCIVAKRLDGSR